MKSSVFALAATIVTFATAQFPGVPQCATQCLATAIAAVGCQITDVACQCSRTNQIAQNSTPCLLTSCTAPGDLAQAASAGPALCVAFSASAAAGASTPAAAPPSPSPAAPVAPSAPASVVTPRVSSIPSPTPTTPPIIGTGTRPLTTLTPTPTSSLQAVTGAAVHNVAGMGVFAGILGAVLAL